MLFSLFNIANTSLGEEKKRELVFVLLVHLLVSCVSICTAIAQSICFVCISKTLVSFLAAISLQIPRSEKDL